MAEKVVGGPAQDRPQITRTTQDDSTAPYDDSRPWWDQVDWQSSPHLCYAKGLQDGVELGREQLNREIVAAMAQALSGGRTTDYAEAVGVHHRTVDAIARRRAADGVAA